MAPLPGFGATGPCWKCRGSGVVAAGRRKRAAGATDLCRVCGGSGALRRGRQRSTEPGRVTQPRSSASTRRGPRAAGVGVAEACDRQTFPTFIPQLQSDFKTLLMVLDGLFVISKAFVLSLIHI